MIYYAYDNDTIRTEQDVLEAGARGDLGGIVERRQAAADEQPTRELESTAVPKSAGETAFEPIGIGRALTIAIREVYTGRYPVWNIFGGEKDMLVTSAVKSVSTYEAKPLALNFLTKGASQRTRMERPQASTSGTPIVFYSPALTERSLTLDLTIVFDQFPAELFQGVANAFNSAAQIPVFIAYGAYLVAAGMIARLAGQMGESLFDGQPAFEATEPINVDWPGTVPVAPGFALITSRDIDRLDPTFRARHRIVGGTLVDSAGERYIGDIPYIIISLDGRTDPGLKDFTPTAASAALLNRFFGIKDGQSKPLDYLIDAIKVYNDFHFRKEVDRIDGEIKGIDDRTEDGRKLKAKLLEQRKIFLDNIGNPELRPPVPPKGSDPTVPQATALPLRPEP